MSGAHSHEVLAQLTGLVAQNLRCWTLPEDTHVTLLNVSENATFLLEEPAMGRKVVVRVHRLGYSSAAEIRSELAWIDALRRDAVIETAAPIVGANGITVQTLAAPKAQASRHAVAFEHLPGKEPDAGTPHWFERLGQISAKMHRHAKAWARPMGFQRKRWDVDAMVGGEARWGPWRAAIGLNAAGVEILEQTVLCIRQRLERYGTSETRFGLVHADLRLANLLVDETQLRIIDFDDCGFSWYVYDFATAVSFIEHDLSIPTLLQAWLTGYRTIAPLDWNDVQEIPTLVILRRILLTAWLASHAEVPFARNFSTAYTRDTVSLAQRFLSGRWLL